MNYQTALFQLQNPSHTKKKQSIQKTVIREFNMNKIQQKYDYMIKLIIVGDSGVGKTNVISAFCNSNYHFNQNHVPTIGVDFSAKIIQMENKNIKLQVWDTAGQQRFRTITQTYYKGASGILLVYSVGDRESFNNIKKWMQQIKQKTNQNVKVILIANKIDLPDSTSSGLQSTQMNKQNDSIKCRQQIYRMVSKRQGWDLAQYYGIRYHEVSAKMNQKIDQIFYNIAQMINNDLQEQLDNTIIDNQQQNPHSYKTNHSGTIQLTSKGNKRAKFRNKKGIVYHKQYDNQQQDQKSIKYCNC